MAAMDPGIPRITAELLRKACVENRGFELPELNEVLILHYRGFRKIENLDDTWKKWMGNDGRIWMPLGRLTGAKRREWMGMGGCWDYYS